MSLATQERVKYEDAWARPVYRSACHSLSLWQRRHDLFPEIFASALDIGCGTGRLMAEWNEQGIDAWGVDIAVNAIDPDVRKAWGNKFVLGCLWEMEWARRFDFGICTDVLEHIPTERVIPTLTKIAECCDEVLAKIAHVPDVCGGGSYHLTVEPVSWWLKAMESVSGEARYLGYEMRSGFKDSLVRWTP